jgi:hypothetical protein
MYIILHLYVVKHSRSFEILKFQMYILWIFKILKLHVFKIVNVVLVCLIGYYHLIFLPSIYVYYMSPWKSLVKMSFFNYKNFHFQKFLTKPKLKMDQMDF